MSQWGAMPTRQPGEALSSINYRTERVPGIRELRRQTALFRHRDNRIWQARIVEGEFPVDGKCYRRSVELTSAGCRTWMFLSMSLEQAQRTVSRFANLEINMYNRLTADADGTSEFPIAGDVGVFCIRTVRQIQVGPTAAVSRTETIHSEITGIARIDGIKIVVFPTSAELTGILAGICVSDTVAIVPQGINEIQHETEEPSSFLVSRGRGLRGVQLPTVSDDELNATITRLRNDTAEGVFSGLQTGDYATTRVREERDIDFFPDETPNAD